MKSKTKLMNMLKKLVSVVHRHRWANLTQSIRWKSIHQNYYHFCSNKTHLSYLYLLLLSKWCHNWAEAVNQKYLSFFFITRQRELPRQKPESPWRGPKSKEKYVTQRHSNFPRRFYWKINVLSSSTVSLLSLVIGICTRECQ